MTCGDTAKRSANQKSLVGLLEKWETLNQQAEAAARGLQKHSAEVRAFLQEISALIETGRWHTSGWNIFDVVGRVRLEDAHSDMLAWLFKPWEAHGLGDRFVRGFVRAAKTGPLPNGRVREVEIRKEIGPNRKKIDIEVQGDGWVLAVENKVHDAEQPGQTESYAEHYGRLRIAGIAVFGVFLTLRGESAKAADFFQPMSYSTLRKILNQARRGNSWVSWWNIAVLPPMAIEWVGRSRLLVQRAGPPPKPLPVGVRAGGMERN